VDQQTAVVIVLVAFLIVALVVMAGRTGRLSLKFWEVEAGVETHAPKNVISGDQNSVSDNNAQAPNLDATTGPPSPQPIQCRTCGA
jgi:hypothetical protein